jgi:hypothetical protein
MRRSPRSQTYFSKVLLKPLIFIVMVLVAAGILLFLDTIGRTRQLDAQIKQIPVLSDCKVTAKHYIHEEFSPRLAILNQEYDCSGTDLTVAQATSLIQAAGLTWGLSPLEPMVGKIDDFQYKVYPTPTDTSKPLKSIRVYVGFAGSL